ncbi:NAD(P)H-dependent flavin oxidoreductase [Acinetobacter baumannii]
MTTSRIDSLMTRLKKQLSLPVIAAPLFIISNPKLVIAQCQAGVIGSFPSLNARPASLLEDWLKEITEALTKWDIEHPERPAAPFAVNLIVHKSNERLEHDLALCIKYQVPIIITSLGANTKVNEAIHAYGGVVFHDVINQRFARKAIEKGADGLIAVAAGAGGHAGTQSPFALIQETRQWFKGPLALSGSITTGRALLAARILGADFGYIGSGFIATKEASANEDYKKMILDSAADDIVYSNLFTGVHGNYLKGSIIAAGLDPEALEQSQADAMNFASGDIKQNKAWRDIWGCGQGIGTIKEIVSVAEFIKQMKAEYISAQIEGLDSE